MANRRFAVHEIRNIISRMRLGETNRQVSQAGLIGRNKAAALRRTALEQGWLDAGSPMPSNEAVAEIVGRRVVQKQDSTVEPYAEQVLAWAKSGVTGVAIHQTLARNFGFTGAYNSVKRFLLRHRETEPATIVLDFKPGEAAQVDFGAGPLIVDLQTGEELKTWFFVMPLARPVEGKIWELRASGRDGIARSLYVTATARRLMILRTFVKKTQKTLRDEIALALKRLKEVE